MKKKLISSVACFVLLVVMFVGSSIAWFTDTAENVNTMVAGKISIDQTEKFDNTTVLLPSMTVEKKVTVENTGNQPCYVRTLFAFEDSTDGEVLKMITPAHAEGAEITIPTGDDRVQFQVNKDGVTTTFTVGYYVYPGQLPHEDGDNDQYTSLTSVTLSENAGNEWMAAIGDKYEIFVLSQAVQTTGLDENSTNALNKVFGDITGSNAATWFAYVLDHNDEYTSDSQAATVEEGSSVIVIADTTTP